MVKNLIIFDVLLVSFGTFYACIQYMGTIEGEETWLMSLIEMEIGRRGVGGCNS